MIQSKNIARERGFVKAFPLSTSNIYLTQFTAPFGQSRFLVNKYPRDHVFIYRIGKKETQ